MDENDPPETSHTVSSADQSGSSNDDTDAAADCEKLTTLLGLLIHPPAMVKRETKSKKKGKINMKSMFSMFIGQMSSMMAPGYMHAPICHALL